LYLRILPAAIVFPSSLRTNLANYAIESYFSIAIGSEVWILMRQYVYDFTKGGRIFVTFSLVCGFFS
jgi:hypothetical protein